MTADPSGPDPKSLWQDQEPEADPMTLEQIHALVRRYERKARRLGMAIAVILVLVGAVTVYLWTRSHDPVMAVLLLGGELVTLLAAWRLNFPSRDPAEPAGAYLRRRLQLKVAHLQGRWLLVVVPLLPVILWMGHVMYERHQAPVMTRLAPFIFIVVGFAIVTVRSRQRARKVKADLDDLNGLLER
jgi:hypothetical protein